MKIEISKEQRKRIDREQFLKRMLYFIENKEPNTYEVKSKTDPTIIYTVYKNNYSVWFCQCMSFVYKQKCRHIDACKKLESFNRSFSL